MTLFGEVMRRFATARRNRLLGRTLRAQDKLRAAIAADDQAAEARWAKRVTKLLAKR